MVQVNYCLVKQNVGALIEDSPGDYDRYPDFKEVTGEVVFTPMIAAGQSFQLKGSDGEMYTVPITRIRGKIVEGKIWHEDEEGVPLFAGGEGANPSSVSYRVTYANLRAGIEPIQLNPIAFTAIPGEIIDLTTVTPISNAPVSGVIKGDKGDKGEDGLSWYRGDIPDDYIVDDMRLEEHLGMWSLSSQKSTDHKMPSDGFGLLTVLWVKGISGYANTIQVWESSYRNDRWTRSKYRDGEWTEWQKTPNLSDVEVLLGDVKRQISEDVTGTKWVGYSTYGNQLLRTDDMGKLSISTNSITENQDVTNKAYVDAAIDKITSGGAGEILRYRGFVSENEDLTKWSYSHRGTWQVPSREVAQTLDFLPVKEPGTLIFNTGEPGYGYHNFIYMSSATIPGFWFASLKKAGEYHPWVNLLDSYSEPDPFDLYEPVGVGIKNSDLMEEMIARKGGTIGTGGVSAFALRLDHGTNAFRDTLASILKKYGLPATMAVYSDQREVNPENNSVEWTEVASWHHSYGVSFGNHSDDHLDKAGPEGWFGGTVGSLGKLREQMPRVPIEQYIPHGSDGFDRYGGFNKASSHDLIFETLAGRMVLSSHALTSGYRGGHYRNMIGRPIQGLTHWSMEESTPSSFKSVIDEAISLGKGIAVMFHPEFIGKNRKMSWEQIDECLSYVAHKRDEGVLIPLTLDGLAVADRNSNNRDDLLSPDLALMQNVGKIYGNFTETPGAFFSDRPDSYVRHLASLGKTPELRGSTRSAEWKISSTSGGTVRLSANEAVDEPDWASQREVEFKAGESVLYLPFGIPLDSSSIRIELTLLSGDITVYETHCYST